MSDLNENTSEEDRLGSAPSLVESFTIEGLHGYRTISLSSKYAATILIAKNGSGKTTLLGALDAVLKRQFLRLNSLDFSRITLKLKGYEQELVIHREDIEVAGKISDDSEIYGFAIRVGIEPDLLTDLLESDYASVFRENYGIDEVADKITANFGYSSYQAARFCHKLAATLYNASPKLQEIRSVIESILGDTEIVYLPTYRRIELPLEIETDAPRKSKRKKSIQSRLGIGRKSLFSTDIQFGLSDISERLGSLNQDILFESNQGYRQISANIINELISGELDKETPGPLERPDKDALNIFFSRIRDNRQMGTFRDVSIPDMDKIYSTNDISTESNRFLSYFLNKLNSVIKATRDIEIVVEEFINNCNTYLSTVDMSTVYNEDESSLKSRSRDDKILVLDRKNLQVKVKSLATGRTMSLEYLSSGEKQMISLFSRLYLYPKKKIVLIDEPELSLSLDWQRKILIDVMRSQSCEQVIAITHSPFVFDNELEPYAKSLDFKINIVAGGSEACQNEDEDEGEINE